MPPSEQHFLVIDNDSEHIREYPALWIAERGVADVTIDTAAEICGGLTVQKLLPALPVSLMTTSCCGVAGGGCWGVGSVTLGNGWLESAYTTWFVVQSGDEQSGSKEKN